MNAGEIFAKIRANAEQFKSTMEVVKTKTKEAGQYIQRNEKYFKSMGIAAGVALATVVYSVKKATDESKEYYKAMLSLRSVAESKGFMGAEKAVEKMEVVRKGFITVQEAATSTANLIKKGFTLDEAIENIEKITAIAFTNKQAHLSLGEAVKSTTEGFKNEISTLSDAGGITKNISDIYDDFAKTIGKTVAQLTEREKAMALMVQIEKEAAIYGNNLAEAMDELAGVEAQAGAETKKLSVAFGEAMEPALKEIYEILIPIIKAITEWIKEHPKLTAVITGGVVVITSLVAILTSAALLIPKITLAMKSLGIASLVTSSQMTGAKIATGGWFAVIASNPLGLFLIALSAVTAGIWAYNRAQEQAREQNIQQAQSIIEEQREIDTLVSKYEQLKIKTNLTVDEKDELRKVTERLKELVPELSDVIDSETEAYGRQIEIVKELAREKNKAILESAALDAEINLPQYIEQLEEAKSDVEKYSKAIEMASQYDNAFQEGIINLNKSKKSQALKRQGDFEEKIKQAENALRAWKEFNNESATTNRTSSIDSNPYIAMMEEEKRILKSRNIPKYEPYDDNTMKDKLDKELNLIDLQYRAKELSDTQYYNKLKEKQIQYADFFKKNEEDRLKLKEKVLNALENIEDEELKSKERALQDSLYNSQEYYEEKLRKAEEWSRTEIEKIRDVRDEDLEALDERQREYYKNHKERLDLLDKETNAAIDEKQKELDAIDRLSREQDYNEEQAKLRRELSQKQAEYNKYKDAVTDRGQDKAQEILRDIERLKGELSDNQRDRNIELSKEAIRSQIEQIQENARKQKEAWQEDYESKQEQFRQEEEDIKTHYETLEQEITTSLDEFRNEINSTMNSTENDLTTHIESLSNRYQQVNRGFMNAVQEQGKTFEKSLDDLLAKVKSKVNKILSTTKSLSLDNGVMIDTNLLPVGSSNVTSTTYITNHNSVNDYGSKIINRDADIDDYATEIGSRIQDMQRGEGSA